MLTNLSLPHRRSTCRIMQHTPVRRRIVHTPCRNLSCWPRWHESAGAATPPGGANEQVLSHIMRVNRHGSAVFSEKGLLFSHNSKQSLNSKHNWLGRRCGCWSGIRSWCVLRRQRSTRPATRSRSRAATSSSTAAASRWHSFRAWNVFACICDTMSSRRPTSCWTAAASRWTGFMS